MRTVADGRPFGAALLAGMCTAPCAPALAQAPSPINNSMDFRTAFTACWSVPPGTDGSPIAFRFGLDKTGALRGPPPPPPPPGG